MPEDHEDRSGGYTYGIVVRMDKPADSHLQEEEGQTVHDRYIDFLQPFIVQDSAVKAYIKGDEGEGACKILAMDIRTERSEGLVSTETRWKALAAGGWAVAAVLGLALLRERVKA